MTIWHGKVIKYLPLKFILPICNMSYHSTSISWYRMGRGILAGYVFWLELQHLRVGINFKYNFISTSFRFLNSHQHGVHLLPKCIRWRGNHCLSRRSHFPSKSQMLRRFWQWLSQSALESESLDSVPRILPLIPVRPSVIYVTPQLPFSYTQSKGTVRTS